MTTRHISVTLELSTIVYNEDVCLAQGWDQKTMIGLIQDLFPGHKFGQINDYCTVNK